MADESVPLGYDNTSNTSDSDPHDTIDETRESPQTPDAAETLEEGALPPGYDWPTHGGYLGCLLSLMASCLIGGFLGTTLFAALSYSRAVPKIVAAVLTVVVFLGVTIGLGRLGWTLGKRFYREYPQTRAEVENEPPQEDNPAVPAERESAASSAAEPDDSSAIDIPIDTR